MEEEQGGGVEEESIGKLEGEGDRRGERREGARGKGLRTEAKGR